MRFALPTLFLTLATAVGQAPPVPAPEVSAPPSAAPGSASGLDKARAAVAAGKLGDALKELQEVAKADPQGFPPRVTLALLLVAANQASAARTELEQAAREDPKHPDIYLANAQFALNEGRITEAVLDARASLEYANSPRWEADQRKRFVRDGRLALAAALERWQDYTAAEENLRAILASEPTNGIARLRLGSALFYQGKPDIAFTELQKAATDDPALPQPELQMATLYASKNETDQANAWRKKAIAARPEDYKPLLLTASALLDQGKVDEAGTAIDAGEKLDKSGKELRAVRGLYYRYKKAHDKAAAIFEELYRDSPNNSVYGWNLALCLAESPEKEKQRRAIELAESEARKNARVTEAFAVLGWCYYKAGQAQAAEQAMVTASQLGPLSPDAGYFLAKLFADRGRFAEAVAALKQVLGTTAAFVYRNEAKALLAEVAPRLRKTTEKS